MSRKPNILFFFADQVRPDILGCCGGPAKTPNLDWIASHGTRFTACTTPAPLCVPARVCLATGKYAHNTGAWNNMPFTVSRNARTWMQQIRDNGYRTALFGKTHLHAARDFPGAEDWLRAYGYEDTDEVDGLHANCWSHNRMTEGWEAKGLLDLYRKDMVSRKGPLVRPTPLPFEDYYDVYVGQRGKEWLKSYGEDKPWFCTVSFPGPHEPWDTPKPYADMYRPEDMPAPRPPLAQPAAGRPESFFDKLLRKPQKHADPKLAARMRADYAGGITLIDDQIGEILDILRVRGELEHTIIVFTSDHGELNGDYGVINKRCYFHPVVDVPLLIYVPGIPGGQICGALVQMCDIGPTLAELAGNPVDYEQFARSLCPLLHSPDKEFRSCVLSECSGEIMYADREWKVLVNKEGEVSQLFDRKHDPLEATNLAGLSEYRETETRLRLLVLEEIMKTTVRSAAVTQGDNPPCSRTGEKEPEMNLPSVPLQPAKISETGALTYSMEQDPQGDLRLRISGLGPMPDFEDAVSQPWHALAERITSVTMEDGITSVGDCNFQELPALTHVRLSAALKFVGTFSFRDCPSLKEISFPEGFENVGSKAFLDDTALTVVRFPSTLRTIDIKSFHGCMGISQVFYAGTPWQWNHYIVVDNSFSANDSVLNAEIHYGSFPDAAADFADISPDSLFLSEIQLLYERSLMGYGCSHFRPEERLSSEELFLVLYAHAGADCMVQGPMEWAGACLGLTPLPGALVTLDFLCETLSRFTAHNRQCAIDRKEADPHRYFGSARSWAESCGFLSKLLSTVAPASSEAPLTRRQCACVLAAYLTAPEADADRYAAITARLRQLIAVGGDGRFHIVAANMNTRGLSRKVGDSSLLILPQGSLMLIDCGFTPASGKLIQFLRDIGVTSLDYLVFSHCHLDHTGGAPDVCRYIYEECHGTIRNFWYTGANINRTNIPVITEYLAERGVIREDIRADESGSVERPVFRTVDGVGITILGPNTCDQRTASENYIAATANGASLVMRFSFGSSVYLTAGDLYHDKESYLLKTYGPEIFHATIAKANHHGNHTSNCQEWVDAVHPQVVLSETDGCGSIDVRKRFLKEGIPYYATGFDGLLHFTMDNDNHFEMERQYDSILRFQWPFGSINTQHLKGDPVS